MSDSVRSEALTRRNARIAEHLRQGKTVGEICDLEGLDPANEPKRMKKDVAEPAGLVIPTGRNTAPPIGLAEVDRGFRSGLGKKLQDLRDRHHYVDVGTLVGMTNKEQRNATTSPWTHNWTLAQMQRLAKASNMTFTELIAFAQADPLTRWKV